MGEDCVCMLHNLGAATIIFKFSASIGELQLLAPKGTQQLSVSPKIFFLHLQGFARASKHLLRFMKLKDVIAHRISVQSVVKDNICCVYLLYLFCVNFNEAMLKQYWHVLFWIGSFFLGSAFP